MSTDRLVILNFLARIWHSDLHFTAHGCIQPHTRLAGKITKDLHSRRSQGLICGFLVWGGWDSNPGPADYESSTPATCPICCDLGRRSLTRSWLPRFGHVFGMIMLDAGQAYAIQAWQLSVFGYPVSARARNVHHRGTVRTRPSVVKMRSTRVIVDCETW